MHDAQSEQKMNFAYALRHYMNKFNISQADVAKRLNVSTSIISCWYNATKMPRADKVQALADYFGVSYFDMLALPATEDFADLEAPGSGIVDEIDSLTRKLEQAGCPLVYGGKELPDEVTAVLEAVIRLVKS